MGMPRGPVVSVVVSRETIEHAVARDSQHCMIADALKECVPDAKQVSVDLATIRFTDPRRGLRYTYLTPRVAQAELVKFDQGIPTLPFQFQLRGAHVTRSGSTAKRRAEGTLKPLTEKQEVAFKASGKKVGALRREKLKRTKLLDRKEGGVVPDRVGGETPPLQKAKDGVPFTRRRAFGLRALEY